MGIPMDIPMGIPMGISMGIPIGVPMGIPISMGIPMGITMYTHGYAHGYAHGYSHSYTHWVYPCVCLGILVYNAENYNPNDGRGPHDNPYNPCAKPITPQRNTQKPRPQCSTVRSF